MGQDKCHQIYCWKKTTTCPTLNVNNESIHKSNEKSYLGDQVSASANNVKTLQSRREKSYGKICFSWKETNISERPWPQWNIYMFNVIDTFG